MRCAVVEITSFQGLGPLEEDELSAVLHEQPRSQGIMPHRVFVEPSGLDIDVDLRAGHAKNFGIKFLGPLQIIDWKTEMMNAFDFEHTSYLLCFYSLRNSILSK
jgi:hypothetical protein